MLLTWLAWLVMYGLSRYPIVYRLSIAATSRGECVKSGRIIVPPPPSQLPEDGRQHLLNLYY